MGDVDVNSFMQVLNATFDTDEGIEFPGAEMPSGRSVTATEATKSMLMGNRSMATQWFESVKAQYEREESEAIARSERAGVPELTYVGEGNDTRQPASHAAPETHLAKTIEEELLGRQAAGQGLIDRLNFELAVAQAGYSEAVKELGMINKALRAITRAK